MDGGFSASYYQGGRGGGVVGILYCTCVHKVVEYDRLREKRRKKIRVFWSGVDVFGITRPIEAGFNKDTK